MIKSPMVDQLSTKLQNLLTLVVHVVYRLQDGEQNAAQ